jgi:hypothetical protein
MVALRPSKKPASFRPCRNACANFGLMSAGKLLRYPITGIAGCCARAASGNPMAAPLRSVMNSRRLNRSPRRRGRAALAEP